ncbi:ribonuclease HI family protein [Halobacillus fulvus]|nr:ribonuclease HI family protein [Halobacillus fulvus]
MITVYTDAAALGNPGICTAGIVIKNGNVFSEYSFFLGELSNHEAEFTAVIHALELCKEQYAGQVISIRSDSKVTVDTLDSRYTKNRLFMPYLEKVKELEQYFPFVFYKWIPEKSNKQADQIARNRLIKETRSP